MIPSTLVPSARAGAITLFTTLALLAGASARADGTDLSIAGAPVQLVASAALLHSGETIAFTRAANGSAQEIRGGGRLDAGFGAIWQAPTVPLALDVSLHYTGESASSAGHSARFSQVPLEAMAYYTGMQSLRVGLGVSELFSPTVKATVDGAEHSYKLPNTSAKSFEIGYEAAPGWWTSLRLSSARYKPTGATPALPNSDISTLSLRLARQF